MRRRDLGDAEPPGGPAADHVRPVAVGVEDLDAMPAQQLPDGPGLRPVGSARQPEGDGVGTPSPHPGGQGRLGRPGQHGAGKPHLVASPVEPEGQPEHHGLQPAGGAGGGKVQNAKGLGARRVRLHTAECSTILAPGGGA